MRKEERKKAEKEKLLQETDPDKTRKWEVCVARDNIYYVIGISLITNYNVNSLIIYTITCVIIQEKEHKRALKKQLRVKQKVMRVG